MWSRAVGGTANSRTYVQILESGWQDAVRGARQTAQASRVCDFLELHGDRGSSDRAEGEAPMGWQHDGAPDHEGYLIAVVREDELSCAFRRT